MYTGGHTLGNSLHSISTIKRAPPSDYSHNSQVSYIMAEINETGEEELVYLTEEELAQYPPLDQDESGDQVDGKSRRGPGYVYLIDEKGTKNFKVGLTCDPDRRLKELQREYGDNLSYRKIVEVSDKQAAENDVLSDMGGRYDKYDGEDDRGREWFQTPGYNKKPIEKWFLKAANKWSV